MERLKFLDEAGACICKTRHQQHGDATDTFDLSNTLIEAYMSHSNKRKNGAHEDGIRQALHKIARIACGEANRDNYVDAIGYIAIAGEQLFEELDRIQEEDEDLVEDPFEGDNKVII